MNLTSKSSSNTNSSTQLVSDQPPRKYNVPDVNVTSKQFVISFRSDSDAELLLSLSSLSGSITNVARPEKIYGNLALDSLIVSTILDSEMTVLLNPCSCNATICLVWESWQCSASSPQIQIQAESDCIYMDLGPKHILIIKSVLADYEKIMGKISSGNGRQSTNLYEEDSAIFTTHEQHYKDDLKSGAFQFVDGTAEELPFPYQVGRQQNLNANQLSMQNKELSTLFFCFRSYSSRFRNKRWLGAIHIRERLRKSMLTQFHWRYVAP